MKQKYRVALLIIWAMPFFSAFSQTSNTHNSEGLDFVILKNGTKVFGKVLREYDFSDYEVIEFESQNGRKTYYPADLQSFQLSNGRLFESVLLPEHEDIEFVQILFTGKLRLLNKGNEFYVEGFNNIERLKILYRENPVDGKKKPVKFYIGQLKILMSGSCGISLSNRIETIRLDEHDLVNLFVDYHNCEDSPYQVHINKIPLFRIKPLIAIGGGIVFPSSIENTQGMAVRLDNNIQLMAEGGIRLQDFRKSPRITLDIRFGVVSMNGVWNSSVSNSGVQITATEDFEFKSYSVPLGLNYSFYKKGPLDFYTGAFVSYKFSKITSRSSIIDFRLVGSGETSLMELQILSVKDSQLVPGGKVGVNYKLGAKGFGFTEIQGQLASKSFLVALPNFQEVNYNVAQFSIVTGFKF